MNVSLLKAVFFTTTNELPFTSIVEVRSPRARYFKTLANKIKTICTTRHTTGNVMWVNWPFMISWTRPEQKPDINSSALQQQAPYLLLRVDNLRGSWTFDQLTASAGWQRQDEEVVGKRQSSSPFPLTRLLLEIWKPSLLLRISPPARYEVSSHYKYLHSVWLPSK